jgi:hypothetical protein
MNSKCNDALSDFAVSPFGRTANATQNVIDDPSNLLKNSFGGADNVTQNVIDALSDFAAS